MPDVTFAGLLGRRAGAQRDDTAYMFLGDGARADDRLSYGELDLRARGIAGALRRCARRGDRVLLLYPPGLDYIAGLLGTLYSGMVAVPAYPPEVARLQRSVARLRAIAADAAPSGR
jgi:acyl-CoA synthetase (AMP-forming)/AMP-acid ligase II